MFELMASIECYKFIVSTESGKILTIMYAGEACFSKIQDSDTKVLESLIQILPGTVWWLGMGQGLKSKWFCIMCSDLNFHLFHKAHWDFFSFIIFLLVICFFNETMSTLIMLNCASLPEIGYLLNFTSVFSFLFFSSVFFKKKVVTQIWTWDLLCPFCASEVSSLI